MFFSYFARLQYFLSDFSGFLTLLFFSTVFFVLAIYFLFKRVSSEQARKIGISLLFGGLFLIISFVFFEGYFRYVYDQSDGLGFLKTSQRWKDRHVQYNNLLYRDNKNYDIDKPSDVTRIAVFGDSLVFAQGINDVDKRFSNLLEANLKKKGKNVQVYNFGISGQDTCEEIKQFRSLNYLPMDIIVWSYYFNDIQPCEDQSTGTKILHDAYGKIPPLVQALSNYSFLFDYIYWRFSVSHASIYQDLRQADLSQFENQALLIDHRKDIATFSAQLKNEGVKEGSPARKVLAIIFPMISLFNEYNQAAHAHEIVNNFFKEEQIEAIDMYIYLKGKTKEELRVGMFDNHPNEYVNQIAAEKLEEKILPLLPN